MTHFTAFGRCFADRPSARRWAAEELERVERRGAHPALVDAAVVLCPADEDCPAAPTTRTCLLRIRRERTAA